VRGFETALNSEIDLLMTRLAEIADGKTTVSMMEEFDPRSLKQQSADRHFAPLGHIILILSQPVVLAVSP
jgi:hypothetical protein